MAFLNLIPIEFKQAEWIEIIEAGLSTAINNKVCIQQIDLDLNEFYTFDRGQHNASEILKKIERMEIPGKSLILTSEDLYIPIFTYVFGLAKLGGNSAIISDHRLNNIFYGLPENDDIHLERIIKEVIHEAGHMMGLRHCHNFGCVMAGSVTIDDLDIKPKEFCEECISFFR